MVEKSAERVGGPTDEDIVEETRRIRRPRGRDQDPVLRRCSCGYSWPSITAYRAGESTRCPRCGAPVDGDVRTVEAQVQATLDQGGVPRAS